MRTIILIVVCVLIGLGLGYLATSAIFGVGAGIGIATGLQAGACLTAESAVAAGLITEDQIPQLLEGAVSLISDASGEPESSLDLGEADVRCAEVVRSLQEAAAE